MTTSSTCTAVFMGTGTFAEQQLRALLDIATVRAIYTQPLRRAGRRRSQSAPNAVRECAREKNIPIYDPVEPLRTPEVFDTLRALAPDIIVVASYGKILPACVLNLPRHGCVNIHASLLPRWRGATPVQAAIAHGDTQTGVTLMRMDTGLDTGDIIAQSSPRTISPTLRAPQLFTLLAHDGAELLRTALPEYCRGALTPRPQNDAEATQCRTLTRQDGAIFPCTHDAATIAARIRAYDPWPGVFLVAPDGTMALKILDATVVSSTDTTHPCGTLHCTSTDILLYTRTGALRLTALQFPGGRPLSATDALNGHRSRLTTLQYATMKKD